MSGYKGLCEYAVRLSLFSVHRPNRGFARNGEFLSDSLDFRLVSATSTSSLVNFVIDACSAVHEAVGRES